jgi:hypothetical protein
MSDSFATEKERLLHVIMSFGYENNRLKVENEIFKEELEELRYIVRRFAQWRNEEGCPKKQDPDFPCSAETEYKNDPESEVDFDECDCWKDESDHGCWVEYYRWMRRQKLGKDTDIPANAPDMDDGRKTETNGKKWAIVEVTSENSDGEKLVFTVPYIETREWVEYETNMPEWERK